MKLDLYIDFDGVILNTIDITYKLDDKEYTETMLINKDLAISNNKLIYPKGETKEK